MTSRLQDANEGRVDPRPISCPGLNEKGDVVAATINVLVSVLLGLAAVALGMSVARRAVVTWVCPDGRPRRWGGGS